MLLISTKSQVYTEESAVVWEALWGMAQLITSTEMRLFNISFHRGVSVLFLALLRPACSFREEHLALGPMVS